MEDAMSSAVSSLKRTSPVQLSKFKIMTSPASFNTNDVNNNNSVDANEAGSDVEYGFGKASGNKVWQ